MAVTREQMDALQAYVSATVRVMTGQMSAHASNVRLYLDSRDRLERVFGVKLPQTASVDLFADVNIQQPSLPDLL